MQYSNKLSLPQYLYDWLAKDEYDYTKDPLTISTTTLMKPAKAYWLTLRHGDELITDVSDLVASRLGTAIHDSIERIDTPNVTKETRVTRQIEIDGQTFTVRGTFDVLTNEDNKWVLRDIKTTSVWAYIYGGKDEDYRRQLSIYRWLLSQDRQVEPVAFIDFIFTDWQATKARTEDNYPPHRIKAGYKIELMSLEETEAYIKGRVGSFFKFKETPDDALPSCTKEELWATDDSFAVMKPDAKRATRVCDSKEEALNYIRSNNLKASIEYRQGKAKRCSYCAGFPFCSQGQNLKKQGLLG